MRRVLAAEGRGRWRTAGLARAAVVTAEEVMRAVTGARLDTVPLPIGLPHRSLQHMEPLAALEGAD